MNYICFCYEMKFKPAIGKLEISLFTTLFLCFSATWFSFLANSFV